MTLKNEIERRNKLQEDGWKDRQIDNYTIKQHDYPFGLRLYAVPNDEQVYKNVQLSRGIHTENNVTDELLLDELKKNMYLFESDQVRYDELLKLNENNELVLFNKTKGFYEIGFRIPKVMKFIGDAHFKFSKGCDITEMSIIVGKYFGYDVSQIDLSKSDFELNLKDVGLIVSYHVLEHIPNPLDAIKRIYNQADKDTFFHVEVPIELGVPRLRYAHMHEFHDGDLSLMLELSGWKVLHQTHKTHSDGPFVDRVFAVKI